jgi:chromosome segregation ATPase
MDEFEQEMKELKKELGKLKSFKFEFDFDNEEFRTEMEALKNELSQSDLNKLQFEFDNEKFRESMEELKKDVKEQKISFDFDMDKFKEEMEGLREELKDLNIDLKDLDIELHKLDGFMDNLREELESDGLIDNKDDDFDLDLSKDKMIINGEPVSEELFKKYKEMYEEHFGKKLDGDHNLLIK